MSRRLRRTSFRRFWICFGDLRLWFLRLRFAAHRREFTNPNAVKVVTALDGRALYFSRATIPFDRDGIGFAGYRKHLGIYAYRKAALERFAALPPSPLEKLERLEQLRLLENGISIYVADAPRDTIGVDTEEDLARAEAMLKDDASRSGT